MNEFFSGGIAGVIAVCASHPFDTLKTLNQSSVNCYKNCYKNKTLSSLYKGLSYPVVGQFSLNGFIFMTENQLYSTTKSHFLSGFITGLISSPVVNYYELHKIRHQYKLNTNVSKYLGIKSTILRDSIGNSIYFGTYYNLRLYNKNNEIIYNFINGGFSGWFSWVFTYWLDTLKTRIQSSEYIMYKDAYNVGKFWNGFKYCSLRCFVSNAVTFSIYEKINKIL